MLWSDCSTEFTVEFRVSLVAPAQKNHSKILTETGVAEILQSNAFSLPCRLLFCVLRHFVVVRLCPLPRPKIHARLKRVQPRITRTCTDRLLRLSDNRRRFCGHFFEVQGRGFGIAGDFLRRIQLLPQLTQILFVVYKVIAVVAVAS